MRTINQYKNDMICRILQKAVYRTAYKGHRPNEWEPWALPEKRTLESGVICVNDRNYGSRYPNSFLDIWYPDDSGEKRPTIVYFHGGGFLFGDKTSGDPMADGGGSTGKLMYLVRQGYNVVNCNYALAPEYRFPVQLEQVDEVFRYLLAHEEELGLDMSRVCLFGSSAGAILTEQYGVCVCSPEYAQRLGMDPVMSPDTLNVLAIDEACMDPETFDWKLSTMLDCFMGSGREDKETMALLNARQFLKDRFIPCWINASNEGGPDGSFLTEAREMEKLMKKSGVDCDAVWFPDADLPHGYMDNYETDPQAREAIDRLTAFLKAHL